MSAAEVPPAETTSVVGAEGMTMGDQYLTFFCDREEYGVDILRVQEIRGWSKATIIPNTPSYMRGVINIRGTIVPIIDLRDRLQLGVVEYDRTTVVIVLRTEIDERERTVGIVVDGVSDVYNLPASQLKPAPEFGSGGTIHFAKSLATVDDKMIIILDVDELYEHDSDDASNPAG